MSLEIKKPRVAVVQTGGTIGSTSGNEGVNVSTEGSHAINEAIAETADELGIEIVSVTSPFMILSENATPQHWQALACHTRLLFTPDLNGILIGHGTDTLQYTSHALSFAYPRVTFPIVLAGAQ